MRAVHPAALAACGGGWHRGVRAHPTGHVVDGRRVDRVLVEREPQVAWRFLGLSMAAWNAVFSGILAVVWGVAAKRA